jgi:hypothetical protein
MLCRLWILGIGAIAFALSLAAPASATTFCVPNTGFAACPGGSVAQTNLETAMQSNASDGIADTIVIDAGTFTDADSFETDNTNTDALEIVGAGPGATRLTTSSMNNVIVVNLNPGSRAVTMRALRIVVPASIPAFQGIGLQTRLDTLENVEIESQGVDHTIGVLFVDGGSLAGGAINGSGGGSFGFAVSTSAAASGVLDLSRLQISNTSTGVNVSQAAIPVNLRRSRIDAPATGVAVSGGGTATVENSVIVDPSFDGVRATSNSASSPTATLRHTTIARVAGQTTANPVSAQVLNVAGYGNASLTATGTIIRGFDNSYFRTAPTDTMVGDANLSLSYSNFPPTGSDSGDGTLDTSTGNINADPLFAGASDFHLLGGSPSIDTADPMPAVAVNEDFDGAPRPVDGNGDSIARRDMGAFEYQPPPPPPPPAGTAPPNPSSTPITRAKRCKKRKAGSRAAVAKKKCKRKRR